MKINILRINLLKLNFILFFCVQFFHTALSQKEEDYRFVNFSMKDGLAYNATNCILKDQRGYLWIGTEQGLSRYNSHEFKNYFQDLNDTTSLSENRVADIIEDDKGYLWIATRSGGLNRYDPKTDQFKSWIRLGDTMKIIPNDLTTLLIDTLENGIWLGTYTKGLWFFNFENESFTQYDLSSLNGNKKVDWTLNSIASIIHDITDKNKIWLGTRSGLQSFDKKLKEVKLFQQYRDGALITMDNHIKCLYMTSSEEIWAGRWFGGLARFDLSTEKWETYPGEPSSYYNSNGPYSNVVMGISMKSPKTFWVSDLVLGLMIFDLETKTYQKIEYSAEDPFSISHNYAKKVYEDKDGLTWIVHGQNGGVSLIDPAFNGFQEVKIPDNKYILPDVWDASVSDFVWMPVEEKLLVATCRGDGLYLFNKDKELEKTFVYRGDQEGTEPCFSKIFIDSKSNIWLSNEGKLLQFDLKNESFEPALVKQFESLQFKPWSITEILEDSDGLIWMATAGGGLMSYQAETDSLIQYVWDSQSFDAPKADWFMTDLIELDDHTLCIGYADNELDFFDKKTKRFRHVSKGKGASNLINEKVTSLETDRYGNIWVGFVAAGIQVLDGESKKTKQIYNRKNGLPSNSIKHIQKDNTEEIWIGGTAGLAFYNEQTQSFLNYTKEEGLADFYTGYGFKYCRDGNFYIGFLEAFNFFNPQQLNVNKVPPPVVFESIKVMDEELQEDTTIDFRNSISLDYDQNFVTINFAALNFSNPTKNQFAYQLEGLNPDWVYPNLGVRTASFSNLAPGNYTFKIKAANNALVWSERSKKLFIEIKAPFWESWWFRLISGLTLFLIGFGIFKYRTNRIKKESELDLKMAELELKAVRAQMNPHFIFNCLNSIKRLMQQEKNEIAIDYLTSFAKLIRNVLNLSDQKLIPLSQELDLSETYLKMEQLRFGEQLEFSIHINDQVDAGFVKVPPMILQPFLENAIWHGIMHLHEKGRLIVNVSMKEGAVLCVIDDNGIGRKQANEIKASKKIGRKSKGLSLVRDRLRLNSKISKKGIFTKVIDKEDSQGKATGTRVEVLIQ